ncbi:hypothetical protein [Clostridium saccharoperbutylacetonicum]|uniref:hypothetical protein n=1 Tax=Clostridium saccharoperbutylacetonicum TaxID=36745 RepID=UPI000983985A|nr:hypothetical protein [Clostridium saccharoperbutylacetonicum]AQR95551.1 hypothetical protein CLSAP_28670 [Clostridium saccharoperbutylacetonicum]NSB31411.1 hypothetical protein [Clostridium saccharoperbutylacetonicum]
MKEQLLNIDLPEKYKEGLIEYVPGLDNEPQWPELQKLGYTWEKHLKLNKLVEIEAMKYGLKDNDITPEEILEIKKLIQNAIEEYNNM